MVVLPHFYNAFVVAQEVFMNDEANVLAGLTVFVFVFMGLLCLIPLLGGA